MSKDKGVATGETKRCEMRPENKGWDPQTLWSEGVIFERGAIMLTDETYDQYVANAKKGDKPWLVMIMRTPYGSNENSYQTGEMMLPRMICASKAMNFNLGILDVA